MINSYVLDKIERAYRSEIEKQYKEINMLKKEIEELKSKTLLNYISNNNCNTCT